MSMVLCFGFEHSGSRGVHYILNGICYQDFHYYGKKELKEKKAGNISITWHWGAFLQPVLQWKSKRYHFPECVFVVLSIQHVMHMHSIFICGPSGSATFSTLSHKRHDFPGEKKLLNLECAFWFSVQLLSETFLILIRIERDMIKKIYSSLHLKYPLFLTDFNP